MTNQEKLISQLEDAIEWFENYASNLDSGRTRSLFAIHIAYLKSIKEKLPQAFDESFAAGQWDIGHFWMSH